MVEFNHLQEKSMTYFQHLICALGIAARMGVASTKTAIHAVYPDVFTTAATDFHAELGKLLSMG